MVVKTPLGETSRLVEIEDAEIGIFNFLDQMFATLVVRVRVPGVMVSVPIAQYKTVFRSAGENRFNVGQETTWAGGRRRNVDV